MFQIEVNGRFPQTFPNGHVGVLLVSGVDNRKRPTPLDQRKREIEAGLRERYAGFSRADFLELEILQAYRRYYKKFNKTYHVQLQLESVVQKGKSLPSVSPLVDANFAAELESLVLTAGHDADLLKPPIRIDATRPGDSFIQISGRERPLRPHDMMMADARGVICTIIYGQDRRTPITPQTRRALYVAYAPEGVAVTAVQQQLALIQENVRLFSPDASVEMVEIFPSE